MSFVVELRPDDLRLDLDGGAITSVLEGGGAEPEDFRQVAKAQTAILEGLAPAKERTGVSTRT